MIFTIEYDKGTRLRVRCGKEAFTKEESYGLAETLIDYDFIDEVKVSHRNGSILVLYNDPKKRIEILRIISKISQDNLYETKASDKAALEELNDKFAIKIAKHILKRYLFKIILPIPLRKLRMLYHASSYIWRGLDSLTSFRADVALLDGTAITASLLTKNYKSVGSMMFLLSISEMLEDYTMQKTKSTLKSSLALNIDSVWKVEIDDEGNEIESQFPLSKLEKGDKIRIRTGAIIPVDGVIADGDAMINEASMTGESLAVHKDNGKAVHAGTVVEEGSIVIEVRSVNDETRLNKIIDMIEDSEELKAGIQSKAEKLADSIVPYSLAATALTYLITRNVTKALSVLMVDFSCAIKLTTPISVISAMKEASDNRIMVKGGKHLEAYANADTIVFDKTGTLTNAHPVLEKVIPCGKYDRDEVLRIAACIEEHFAHSVATAIVKQAEKEGLHHEEDHSEVEYIVAHGISTTYDGKKAIIGSRHFLEEDEGIRFTKKQEKLIEENAEEYSVIYLAIGKKLQGILCIADPVRDEAHEVISQLKALGIENVVMLTGDSENAAKRIAKDLGITRYKSQVLPEDKASIIQEIKAEGHQVIMVGDGINDSPALSAADVSVAMRNSSDIAREVADISLLSDDLYDLATLRLLATGMLDKINTNYRHIVMFNGSLIGLGLLGVIPPTTSSLLHNLSTMLFGYRSTKSVLGEKEEVVIDTNVINNDGALIGQSGK
ncbi:ATPase [Methanobrevibacter ruminantium M1]|uniref:ATPase n=1 Tax=Methanobrevibacter ruminantium (strain ATCC 35063 / DSM 1093 / JCM 13430 / OCM 146 / M1) TaxID=634498 RepID=D3E1A2_METRM|nr:heavy metal translocating P-type ATPase [Methanobrevibacter ruminantium]ADC46385.1 ATPase [Methanobrevibacter ruminantium M1]